jgi:hypothetical protein
VLRVREAKGSPVSGVADRNYPPATSPRGTPVSLTTRYRRFRDACVPISCQICAACDCGRLGVRLRLRLRLRLRGQ